MHAVNLGSVGACSQSRLGRGEVEVPVEEMNGGGSNAHAYEEKRIFYYMNILLHEFYAISLPSLTSHCAGARKTQYSPQYDIIIVYGLIRPVHTTQICNRSIRIGNLRSNLV